MYKTANGWTKEKMKAQIRLKNNGTRSSEGSRCVYRTKDGSACAVGCFIPDGHEALDTIWPASTLVRTYPSLASLVPLTSLDGLNSLQCAHDRHIGLNLHEALFSWIDENVEDA